MVLIDGGFKLCEVMEAIGILHGSGDSILNQQLDMKKLSERLMPRLITIDRKRNQVSNSKERLVLFNRNLVQLCRCFITWRNHGFITRHHAEAKLDFFNEQLFGMHAYNPHRLVSKGKNCHWLILCQLIQSINVLCQLIQSINDDLKKNDCMHLTKKKGIFH